MKNKLMKNLKVWILVMAMVATAAGAAAGTIVSGSIQGGVNVAVSQPIKLEKPIVRTGDGEEFPRSWFTSVTDDFTRFSAALQLYQGESAIVKLPIVNRADVDHVIEITITAPTLTVPRGGNPSDYNINLEVEGSGLIQDVVRVGPYKWKATVPDASNGLAAVTDPDHPVPDGLKVTVALGDLVPPGYYELTGQIQVVPY